MDDKFNVSYVGQTEDDIRRISQHIHADTTAKFNFGDLRNGTAKVVAFDVSEMVPNLNERLVLERIIIYRLQAENKLRNKKISKIDSSKITNLTKLQLYADLILSYRMYYDFNYAGDPYMKLRPFYESDGRVGMALQEVKINVRRGKRPLI